MNEVDATTEAAITEILFDQPELFTAIGYEWNHWDQLLQGYFPTDRITREGGRYGIDKMLPGRSNINVTGRTSPTHFNYLPLDDMTLAQFTIGDISMDEVVEYRLLEPLNSAWPHEQGKAFVARITVDATNGRERDCRQRLSNDPDRTLRALARLTRVVALNNPQTS